MIGMSFNLLYLLIGGIIGFFIGTQFELEEEEDNDETTKEKEENHKNS